MYVVDLFWKFYRFETSEIDEKRESIVQMYKNWNYKVI